MRTFALLLLAACGAPTTPAETPIPPGPPETPTEAASTEGAPTASGSPQPASAEETSTDQAATPSGSIPEWAPTVRELTAQEREAMTGVSWHPECPIPLDELRLIEMPHHLPGGGTAQGELIVNADAVDPVLRAFGALYAQEFRITKMRPVREFGADDDRSMAADNTSAFNCRPVYGGRTWSEHAFGRAIDINPLRNPYVRGERVDPPGGREWLVRDASRPGVLVDGSPAVQAFLEVGWKWGGHWRTAKDYQHFSSSGR